MLHPSIMLVSGDNASDRFGAGLARALHRAAPDVRLFGIGGWQMQEAGVDILYNTADLDNLGILDAFKGGAVLKRVVRRANQMMEDHRPMVVVQIGLPVFDYRLMDMARCKDIPVVYYYTPFSSGFVTTKPDRLSGLVSVVAAVTQKEADVWRRAGVPTEFVGHPLVDLVQPVAKEQAREHLGLSLDEVVVTLIPGSRDVEVKAALPLLLKAAERVHEAMPEVAFVVAQPQGVSKESFDRFLTRADAKFVQFSEFSSLAVQAADVAVLHGGTAVLEAALFGIPALAVYKIPTATYLMDKMLERKAHWAMPNILLEASVVPELIQHDFTESKTADWILALLRNPELRQTMRERYSELAEQVGPEGALERAAQLILSTAVRSEDQAKRG